MLLGKPRSKGQHLESARLHQLSGTTIWLCSPTAALGWGRTLHRALSQDNARNDQLQRPILEEKHP